MSADHIPDHNALWGTRKQCGKERQRATFPERKPLHVVVWIYSQSIISLWEQDVGGSNPFTPTLFLKGILRIPLRNIIIRQRMKGFEGER